METNSSHLPGSFTDADGYASIRVVAEVPTALEGVRVRFDNGEVRHYYRRTCVALVRKGRANCDVAAAIQTIDRNTAKAA